MINGEDSVSRENAVYTFLQIEMAKYDALPLTQAFFNESQGMGLGKDETEFLG